MWKLELKTEESLVYQKKDKNFEIKIEARKEESVWKIYKIINYQKQSLVNDYEVSNIKEVKKLISKIKNEELSSKEITELFELKKEKGSFFRLYRSFFSQDIEKWDIYSKNKEEYYGFVYSRYADNIFLDINLLSKFKYLEKEIVEEIQNILSIKNENTIEINIFYFDKMKNQYKEAVNYEMLLDKLNFVLDDNDE